MGVACSYSPAPGVVVFLFGWNFNFGWLADHNLSKQKKNDNIIAGFKETFGSPFFAKG